MRRLAAAIKNSNATRRLIMPFVLRFPTLPGRLAAVAQRFAKDIAHPDWPAPLPAAYLRLPQSSRKVLLDLARAAQSPPAAPVPGRLAWVTAQPLDAVEAALLGQLARHYAIDVINPAPDGGARSEGGLPIRSGAWFEEHHAQFDRIVYHVANSPAHGTVLRLLARHPGIVVLDDFFLGAAVTSLDAGGLPHALPHVLFHAHGYSGVQAWRRLGDTATLAAFPLNRIVFDHATGILVDPADIDAMRAQAHAWYGPRSAAELHPADLDTCAAAIEDIAANSASARYRRRVRELAGGMAADPRNRTLIATAKALAADAPSTAPRQLLLDISAVAGNDLKTGIQRVVRSIVLALIDNPPAGFRVEPVYGSGAQRRYRYARRFTLGLLGVDNIPFEDDPIDYQQGDIFLCLDLSKHDTLTNLDMLDAMRARDVAVYFVLYDILPLLQPDDFPHGSFEYFSQYVQAIGRHADGAVCISRAVADEVGDWLETHGGPRATPFRIAHFHLGADLAASAPSTGMPDDAAHVLASMAARPSLLMVGTLEPRKAHAQALAALDLLWRDGVEVNLVIIGKQGWMVEPLVAALRAHPQLGKKLFWLPGVSDQMLAEAYRLASALLAPSRGEGFGLPLIEAAQQGVPIIARNLPVFREVSGDHAFYFDGEEPAQLAAAIAQWLALFRQGLAPASAAMPWLTWADSAQQLLDAVVRGRWYRTLPAEALPGSERL